MLWVFLGPAAEPALCIAEGCDCERIGAAPVRQPVAAWSAWAIAAIGWVAIATAPTVGAGLLGLSVAATGAAAFAAHALATPAARRLDGLAIVVLLAAVIAGEASRRWPRAAILAAVPPILVVMAGDLFGPATAILGALLVALLWRNRQGRDPGWVIASFISFGIGTVIWWIGGGPGCSPDAVFQWHGAWHVVAAAGLGTGLRYLRD